MTHPDETLLTNFVAGDGSAFETLVGRHRTRLLAFVTRRLGGDSHAAEDVVQGVFIKIARYAHTFREGAAFRPWLYSMCDRLMKDHLRVKRRRESRFKRLSTQTLEGDEYQQEWLVDPEAHEAHDILSMHHDLEKVSKTLRQLPRKYRTALHLSMKGFSTRQGGSLLGISYDTFHSRVQKAKELIAKQMRGETIDTEVEESLEEGTIRDIVDALPDGEYQSVERVVFEDDSTDADLLVFRNFLNRLLGNFSRQQPDRLLAAS